MLEQAGIDRVEMEMDWRLPSSELTLLTFCTASSTVQLNERMPHELINLPTFLENCLYIVASYMLMLLCVRWQRSYGTSTGSVAMNILVRHKHMCRTSAAQVYSSIFIAPGAHTQVYS